MFKILDKVCEPTKGSKYSACIDLYSNEDITIGAGETAIVGLGVEIDIDWNNIFFYNKDVPDCNKEEFLKSHYIKLEPRSSLRAKGLIVGTGIIDLDYPNELKLIVHNTIKMSNNQGIPDRYLLHPFVIKKGDKIAQAMLCVHKSYLFGIESEDERTGGIGSTGE